MRGKCEMERSVRRFRGMYTKVGGCMGGQEDSRYVYKEVGSV